MGGGNRFHVVDFAVSGEAAVEIIAVPRGEPLAAIARVLLRRVGLPADHIRPADAVDAPALRHRLAGLDHPRRGSDAVFRIKTIGEPGCGARTPGQREATERNRAELRDAMCQRGLAPAAPVPIPHHAATSPYYAHHRG